MGEKCLSKMRASPGLGVLRGKKEILSMCFMRNVRYFILDGLGDYHGILKGGYGEWGLSLVKPYWAYPWVIQG